MISGAPMCQWAAALTSVAGFSENHAALVQGDNNQWAIKNSPFSLGYFKREDISTYFADTWTVGDMYIPRRCDGNRPSQQSGSTTSSINVPGGPQTLDEGGVQRARQ
ncbi:hypothetical protein K439DRAFT_652309 [Ramaria rubella]|nr:hypothetical protein K439DRAFT_652309 [Ramaria rubella]